MAREEFREKWLELERETGHRSDYPRAGYHPIYDELAAVGEQALPWLVEMIGCCDGRPEYPDWYSWTTFSLVFEITGYRGHGDPGFRVPEDAQGRFSQIRMMALGVAIGYLVRKQQEAR